MNDTIGYLIKKFNLDLSRGPLIEIHNVNRPIMAKTLGELGFKVGAEVGVAQGYHAELLCKENPGLKLFCVDIWEPYPGYRDYANRIHRYYNLARRRLSPYNCVLVKKFSMDAVNDFKDESLDFVYIDGAHDFKNAACDICEWSKKVRVGGIVFGHDYARWSPRRSHLVVDVKDVIQAYVQTRYISPWFVLMNDLGDGMYRKDSPGWLFVRQENDYIRLP